MSIFPGSPRLLKGGIALLDPSKGTVQQILPLQYNPDTLTRRLKIKGVGAESGDHIEALRLTGPPTETIKAEKWGQSRILSVQTVCEGLS